MSRQEYTEEALANSCEEHGITLTQEQCAAIASDMRNAFDMEGEAFGDAVASRNLHQATQREISTLQSQLEKERAMVVCPECHGQKTLTSFGPYYSSTSVCWKCKGKGRVE